MRAQYLFFIFINNKIVLTYYHLASKQYVGVSNKTLHIIPAYILYYIIMYSVFKFIVLQKRFCGGFREWLCWVGLIRIWRQRILENPDKNNSQFYIYVYKIIGYSSMSKHFGSGEREVNGTSPVLYVQHNFTAVWFFYNNRYLRYNVPRWFVYFLVNKWTNGPLNERR